LDYSTDLDISEKRKDNKNSVSDVAENLVKVTTNVKDFFFVNT